MDYINAFWVGGLICALTQILMEKTKLMPGRIMVLLVCTGAVLGAVGKHEMPPFAWQMPELLVFSGLQENSLQLFLAAYREAQIEQIPLKAIVTPHNISWSIYELSRELASEHAAMHP